ncbi:MAG: DUF402 domain-containing protein [Candidatus Ranarchaeia archaeon]
MVTARISGIYSTALTLFLLEQGFQIQKPTSIGKPKKPKKEEPVDITIQDRWNHHGVIGNGQKDAVNRFIDIIEEHLPDTIIRHSRVGVGGIYKAKILESNLNREYCLVALSEDIVAVVPEVVEAPAGDSILVEIKDPDVGGRKARATQNVTFASDYAVLFPGQEVKISRRIVDKDKRARLMKIGSEHLPETFSILWRTVAEDQPDEVLIEDLKVLDQRGIEIMGKVDSAVTPSCIWSGITSVDLEFPLGIKRKMDLFRRQAIPTIKDHHALKSAGNYFGLAVDLGERVLDKVPQKKVEQLIKSLSAPEYPVLGSTIGIEHVKVNGHIVDLGPAQVIETRDTGRDMVLRRYIRGRGSYDYLGERKMRGDYAYSYAKAGSWFMKTKYFGGDSHLKGTYVNINTEVEVYPWAIHYIDLCVDVIQRPNGEIDIIDLDELNDAYDAGYISKKLKAKALKVAKEEAERLKKDFQKSSE